LENVENEEVLLLTKKRWASQEYLPIITLKQPMVLSEVHGYGN